MNESIDFKGDWGTVITPQGKLVFCVEEGCATIHEIEVSKQRCGIGSRLASCLERFLVKQNVAKIFVPATPSKQSVSFWLKNGFSCIFPEERKIVKRILNKKSAAHITNTGSGIIALRKEVGK